MTGEWRAEWRQNIPETLTYEVCGREVPVASWETANKVMTPRDILPGTDSMSIQKETQDTATISIDGR